MVFFLYGPETFLSKRKLSEIIEKRRLKYKSGLNFAKIEISEDNFDDFKNKVETVSMFQEKKLIVVKNALLAPKSLQEKIKKYLKEKDLFEKENIVLIFFEEVEIKNKTELYKLLLKKSFKKQEFKNLPPSKIIAFIKKEVEEKKGEISSAAAEKLSSYCGNDVWHLENELNKVISFKKGKIIQSSDVENLCEEDVETNVFKTIEAIANKNKRLAVKLISDHFNVGGKDEKIIFSMIVYQFRNLIKIRSVLDKNRKQGDFSNAYGQLVKSGIHPFVVRKNLPIARSFPMDELKKIYQKLFELDYQIKMGRVDMKLGIEMFIAGL